MSARHRRASPLRQARFESFEERLALSAHPVADFYLSSPVEQRIEMHLEQLEQHLENLQDFDNGLADEVDQQTGQLEQHLGDVHDVTGVNYVYDTYGFTGTGQTVAVIDSGIAWDHVALGGGLGTGYRVVGGWDFAENDADPYDDAPSGFHGTHVAGIIGSSNATYRGVAPEVDLVSLRVFDDDGGGYFSWVESALRWVHDHRHDFASPITTVNMSLGTDWNSDSIPNWTTIEDELAQLEQDGIFIAVSAGNSFADYNATGLSYPAASPSVVPVASVTNAGSFSSFSQRHDRVIAAPGSSITSTVPDYVFGADGNPNDYGTASGTSMASPYVAGASVLIRQAMEFVGVQNVTQDTIYDHIRNTADVFYDTATDANYHRLNVQAALDALMPADDYGSSINDAHNLGILHDNGSFSGLIGAKSDQDYFTFTAGATGTVRFEFDTNFNLDLAAERVGGSGAYDSNVLSWDVTSGSSYMLSLATSEGIGFYSANVSLEEAFNPTDLGVVDFSVFRDQSLSGESWFRLQATRDGLLTVEALFDHASGNIDLEVYNSDLHLITSSTSTTNDERTDTLVSEGSINYIRVVGSNQDVDLRLANLVSLTGSHLSIAGTSASDSIEVDLHSKSVIVNGVGYQQSSDVTSESIGINAGTGRDELRVGGTAQNETAVLRVDNVNVSNSSVTLEASQANVVRVDGRGGLDTVSLYDASGNDMFVAASAWASLQGEGFNHYVTSFEFVHAFSESGGSDRAYLYDSNGNDNFVARAQQGDAYLSGDGFFNMATGFSRVDAYATLGGNDRAYFYDSEGDDQFFARAEHGDAYLRGDGFYHYARGFDRNDASASAGGYDRAYFYDSEGDDQFFARAGQDDAYLRGAGFYNYARGFDRNYAYADAGGYDRANFYDSEGDDQFCARAEQDDAYLRGEGFYNYARGFDRNYAYVNAGGYDRAYFYDSAGDDHFYARGDHGDAYLRGDVFYNYARGFARNYAYANAGGHDRAYFYDGVGDNRFYDRANLADAYMNGNKFFNYARGFDHNYAYANAGGTDLAMFSSIQNGSLLYAKQDQASVAAVNGSKLTNIRGCDAVVASSVQGAVAVAEINAVDYVLDLFGAWD